MCLTLSGSIVLQELASIIKLSSFNTFSLFECRKNLNGSRSLDATIGVCHYPISFSVLLYVLDEVDFSAVMILMNLNNGHP